MRDAVTIPTAELARRHRSDARLVAAAQPESPARRMPFERLARALESLGAIYAAPAAAEPDARGEDGRDPRW